MSVDLISVEAEQAVIGAVMLDNRVWELVGNKIRPDHFSNSNHRDIIVAIAELSAKGHPFDLVTLSEKLPSVSISYLAEIAKNTPSTSAAEHYASIVVDRHIRRTVAAISFTGPSVAREAESGAAAVGEIRNKLDSIETVTESSVTNAKQAMQSWIDVMMKRKESGGTLQGIPTGFDALNARWGGLCDTDLIVIAGRPSMGKTTFGMNIAESAAANGKSVLFFSLEMSSGQLMDKRVSAVAGVSFSNIKSAELEQHEWDMVQDCGGMLKDRPFYIDDKAGVSVDYIRLCASAHKSRHGLNLIVVDHMQIASCPGAENRLQEMSKISGGLKKIAKDLKIPVIALSQLNRQCEARANKRPTMADLRESGSIEQDADIVAFVYRHEKYHPDDANFKGVVEIITDKNRSGEIGTDYFESQLRFSRFANRDPFDGRGAPESSKRSNGDDL